MRDPPQSIPFLEFRASPLIEGELVVAGTLEFLGARRLARVVASPYPERTDIDGDTVTIRRAGKAVRRFSLRRSPELAGLLAGFSAILAGDRAALEREFEVVVAVDASSWRLELVPRSEAVRRQVSGIRVHGAGEEPRCIVTTGGDGSVIAELLLGDAARDPVSAQQRAADCGRPA